MKESLQHYLDIETYYTPGEIARMCDVHVEDKIVKTNKKIEYFNIPCSFDIETTSFYEDGEKRAIMYEWTLGINGGCMIGRTWEEFHECMNYISKRYKLSSKRIMIFYVQNFAYEFQFIRKHFEWEKVFSLDTRNPVYALSSLGIEFRCSYVLSGYSLDKMGKNLLKYKCLKKTGDLDYELKRHSETPLTKDEIGYCLNDVKVVMAYIQERIEEDGDITLIPLTKTGYVRKYCRKICFNADNEKYYRKLMKRLTLKSEEYKMLKRAFQGGFTHANAFREGKTFEDVDSYDFTSSYPAVMVAEKFPMSRPIEYKPRNMKDFLYKINNFCCLFDVRFTNIRGIRYEHPISSSHCWEKSEYIENNGRIEQAKTLSTTITELDFKIYQKFYKWDSMEVGRFYYFYKNYLPTPFVKVVLDLYVKKTTLKDVVGMEAEYASSKEKVNALFGMGVTDIVRDEIVYSDDLWDTAPANLEEEIEHYNKSWNRFLYYPWGVWIPAYGRYNLFTGIYECDSDYIYGDTDSVKILNRANHVEYFERYNREIERKLKDALKYHMIDDEEMICPKTIKGTQKPLGAWDYEGKYTRFKTLGAKRYMYEKEDDKGNLSITITIAGVNKKKGSQYMAAMKDPFKGFDNELIIPPDHTGKLIHSYIDEEHEGELTDYLGSTSHYYEPSAIHMEKTPYHLSLSDQYMQYLMGIRMNDKR